MKRLGVLAALAATLLISSGAMACQEVRAPEASITICGDPHAVIRLDNDASTVDVTFRVVYWSGRTDVRRVERIGVPDGNVLTIRRFVRGGGRKVSVYDQQTGDVLARVTVTRDKHSGACA